MKKTILSLLVGFSVASQAFADDLYQVYQQAMQHDPATLAAKARRDAAYSSIDSSMAALLPSLGLGLSADRTGGDSDITSNSASLQLTQSIYDHSNWQRLDRAELVATQADANYAQVAQALILRTVSAYFNVLQAQDDLDFARAEKRAIERQLEQTKQRFAVGLTAITDVHEAQALFDNAVASEISAQNQVEVRLEALREITGSYHGNLNVLNTQSFSANQPMPAQVEGWLQIAEDKNLNLMVAMLGVDIAKQDIEVAKAGHYPTVDLTGRLSSYDEDRNGVELPSRANTNYIGLEVKVPIYSGGATTAATDTARHNFVASSEDREQVYRSVVRSVRSNYFDVTASISRIKALEQAVVSAESALKATEAGFEVGTRTIVDVLNSTRNLYDAKRNLSGARYGYINSTLSLKQAAGTLSDQDVQDINRGLSAPAQS
ncbi:outer membrane channel protein TolC [Aliiglaciecola sp. CAU 1673]|uniref:outer membrane channel protein TolC n=1 Tax=Aliiglaciecola sp. CAU 1673 TaxID=3032595 RepID=UPI0023DCD62A|nr:outer membrane channel protein TolC [Aliiglaciecola sp. CAU 1673]MDF2180381.1 outer membrane channel protein TolC [Aliiglaciecola sp. CAU 1673]